MKCPVDQSEMEEGVLVTGMQWHDKLEGVSGKIADNPINNVLAYKCPNCGKIELTSKN